MPRPKNIGVSEELRLRVPANLVRYLQLVARNSVSGSTANEIASFILVTAIRHMIKTREHEVEVAQLLALEEGASDAQR